ncbi:MAG: hypothetical protein HC896_04580 [Bacteroidales bacterium]|nr:hypothetical protein [Bacteroidales bacterium]
MAHFNHAGYLVELIKGLANADSLVTIKNLELANESLLNARENIGADKQILKAEKKTVARYFKDISKANKKQLLKIYKANSKEIDKSKDLATKSEQRKKDMQLRIKAINQPTANFTSTIRSTMFLSHIKKHLHWPGKNTRVKTKIKAKPGNS